MKQLSDISSRHTFSRNDLLRLLKAEGEDHVLLLAAGNAKKQELCGNKIYLRGLVELSNICSKNCYYCGIRQSNDKVIRYDLSDSDILEACRFARESMYGSVVLQSGEISSPAFTRRIDNLLREITRLSHGELGITLSCGQQSRDTYKRWFDSGAHRYLLRIETSDRDLYAKIHPADGSHSFDLRIDCLHHLRECGYQVGSGVMIGLPWQTEEHLADDLLFLKYLDIDMAGMGPYIEHSQTPLFLHAHTLRSRQERLRLSLNMIAALRLLMPDINIAASTALDAAGNGGREKALTAGANVIMPNITPARYRKEYLLYEDKPCQDTEPALYGKRLLSAIRGTGNEPGWGERGDSKHYRK